MGAVSELSDDEQIREYPIIRSAHKVKTTPIEYSRQLRRIMDRNPTLTVPKLAFELGKSPKWISEQLSLTTSVSAS
jgi:hypothetical protein